jgi:hypothetical protein
MDKFPQKTGKKKEVPTAQLMFCMKTAFVTVIVWRPATA